ncbi:hypothetical protein LH488_28110, partial [Klebsiella pneumoniae]|uniref:hypothetical protein n=1 Tax=Klebsiella pneumoniae TaxID=573 RepID=UPI001E43101B
KDDTDYSQHPHSLESNRDAPPREEQESVLKVLGMVCIDERFQIHEINWEWCEHCREYHGCIPDEVESVLATLSKEALYKLGDNIANYRASVHENSGHLPFVSMGPKTIQ